jgi:hypothetical protein
MSAFALLFIGENFLEKVSPQTPFQKLFRYTKSGTSSESIT